MKFYSMKKINHNNSKQIFTKIRYNWDFAILRSFIAFVVCWIFGLTAWCLQDVWLPLPLQLFLQCEPILDILQNFEAFAPEFQLFSFFLIPIQVELHLTLLFEQVPITIILLQIVQCLEGIKHQQRHHCVILSVLRDTIIYNAFVDI